MFNGPKVLLLKKRDFDFKDGKWVKLKRIFWRLPKGKLEKGETQLQGLKRELREETGMRNVKIGKKVFSYQYQAPKGITHRTVFCYTAFTREKPQITRDAKVEGIEKSGFYPVKTALKKLKWVWEKKSLKAALRR